MDGNWYANYTSCSMNVKLADLDEMRKRGFAFDMHLQNGLLRYRQQSRSRLRRHQEVACMR